MDLRGQGAARNTSDGGYAMAALLVSLAVMSVLMSVALPVWRHEMQREKEAELIFRGEQYVRAIDLYQRKYPGAFPPDLDVLVQQRFLRKKFKDPMTEDGEFQLLYASGAGASPGRGGGGTSSTGRGTGGGSTEVGPRGATGQAGARGGIIGVVSKSEQPSIKVYKGRTRYNEWQFIYAAVSRQPGGPVGPGAPGRPGGPGPVMGQPGPGRGGRGFPGGLEPPGGRGRRGRGPGVLIPDVEGSPPPGRGVAPVTRPPGGRGR